VPVAACEYAAAGLALVSGVPGDLATHIDRSGAGVACAADNAGMWADALAALATDRRRLLGLRDGARRLAAAVFDRETTSARFATWLEAVAVGMTDELT
jgi:glycosyltransferase involved in cell wall biosynthesis